VTSHPNRSGQGPQQRLGLCLGIVVALSHMSDTWEDDDFVASLPNNIKKRWDDEEIFVEGFDEKPATKESWEDEEKPKEKKLQKPEAKQSPKPKVEPPPPKEIPKELTETEIQEQQLKSDYEETLNLFSGVTGKPTEDALLVSELENLKTFKPNTKPDFEKFAESLAKLIVPYATSFFYRDFLKVFVKKITADVTAEDLREIVAALLIIVNEKIKQKKKERQESCS